MRDSIREGYLSIFQRSGLVKYRDILVCGAFTFFMCKVPHHVEADEASCKFKNGWGGSDSEAAAALYGARFHRRL